MLNIQTWGGWGDVLREISLLPLPGPHRPRWKCCPRVGVSHLPAGSAGIREDAKAPSPEAVEDLLMRCPGLIWKGMKPLSRLRKLPARVCRTFTEFLHPGLFDPGFVWRAEDALELDRTKAHIVVQTHLDGLPSKRWDITSWRDVLTELRNKVPSACLHVLDPAGSPLRGEGIIIQDKLTFPQAIRLVERSNLLISVDSWSKYVAAWNGIPQVIIVPDQTPDYPQLTASAVWRFSFRGLRRDPRVVLIGLEPHNNRSADYLLRSMADLSAEQVIVATHRFAEKLG